MNGEHCNTPAHVTTETVTKLDPELKAKWLEALRSDRYKQGTSGLRDSNNCYCCIGVLADILDPAGWSITAEHQGYAQGRSFYGYHREPEMLSPSALCALGLEHVATHLASMNDGEGGGGSRSFAEIADWIEANL